MYLSEQPILVIDGHSAHRSKQIDYAGFKVLMTPPYTSYLNSQETVWSVLKRFLFKHFAQLDCELKTFSDVEREMKVVIKQFKKDYTNKVFMHSCRRDLEEIVNW